MAWFSGLGIQNKLLGIFTVIALAGVAALGWNIVQLNSSRDEVSDVLDESQAEVGAALVESQGEVRDALDGSVNDVTEILDEMDALLLVETIEIDFRQLEALETELVFYSDIDTQDAIRTDYYAIYEALGQRLAFARRLIQDPDILTVMDNLGQEYAALPEHFETLYELMTAYNVGLAAWNVGEDDALDVAELDEAYFSPAWRLQAEESFRRIDAIYNPLGEIVGTRWQATLDESTAMRGRVQGVRDETDAQLGAAIDTTDESLASAKEDADDSLLAAINVSWAMMALFAVAGGLVAVMVVTISRQIVRPVLTMSEVAESIEREEYTIAPLDSVVGRQDEIGLLARVFQRMAKEVYDRVEKLKQQVVELQIVIDEKKVSEEVSQIVESDYFQDLQSKARALRRRDRSADEPAAAEPDSTAAESPSSGE
ncbi:MAG: HAMP domain-containing protein [Chloroflexi bacterium]|nr:HAMP domain-containing protein [Chloroflexota bacterium]